MEIGTFRAKRPTFPPRGKKYAVRVNGEFRKKPDGSLLIIKKAAIPNTRQRIAHEDKQPLPDEPPVRIASVLPIGQSRFSRVLNETRAVCPKCYTARYKHGRFTGVIECDFCHSEFRVV